MTDATHSSGCERGMTTHSRIEGTQYTGQSNCSANQLTNQGAGLDHEKLTVPFR